MANPFKKKPKGPQAPASPNEAPPFEGAPPFNAPVAPFEAEAQSPSAGAGKSAPMDMPGYMGASPASPLDDLSGGQQSRRAEADRAYQEQVKSEVGHEDPFAASQQPAGQDGLDDSVSESAPFPEPSFDYGQNQQGAPASEPAQPADYHYEQQYPQEALAPEPVPLAPEPAQPPAEPMPPMPEALQENTHDIANNIVSGVRAEFETRMDTLKAEVDELKTLDAQIQKIVDSLGKIEKKYEKLESKSSEVNEELVEDIKDVKATVNNLNTLLSQALPAIITEIRGSKPTAKQAVPKEKVEF